MISPYLINGNAAKAEACGNAGRSQEASFHDDGATTREGRSAERFHLHITYPQPPVRAAVDFLGKREMPV